jgi:hypothetical protein
MYSMLVKDNFQKLGKVNFEFHYPEIEKIDFTFKGEENLLFKDWLNVIWERTQKMEFNHICKNPKCVYCKMKLN